MESAYQPLVLGNPNEGLKNSVRPEALGEKDFKERLDLASAFDESFHGKFKGQKAVRAQKAIYDDAVKLMKSEDLKAFDLAGESDSIPLWRICSANVPDRDCGRRVGAGERRRR